MFRLIMRFARAYLLTHTTVFVNTIIPPCGLPRVPLPVPATVRVAVGQWMTWHHNLFLSPRIVLLTANLAVDFSRRVSHCVSPAVVSET